MASYIKRKVTCPCCNNIFETNALKGFYSNGNMGLDHQRNSEFEPFFGMNEMQVVLSLRQLAYKLNYSVTPRFERVVKAHLSILKELNIPISLSGLNYLCQFYDIGEFHENIMALPCGEAISRRIWADLGIDSEDSNSQFDLFRAVISNLSHDASRGGWNDNNCVAELRIIFISILGIAIGFAAAIAYGSQESSTLIFVSSAIKSIVGAILMEIGTDVIGISDKLVWFVLWILISVTIATKQTIYKRDPRTPSRNRSSRRLT